MKFKEYPAFDDTNNPRIDSIPKGWLIRKLKHISDVMFPLEPDLKSLPVVSLAVANIAGHIDIRQELHFDLQLPVPPASLTAAALYIK